MIGLFSHFLLLFYKKAAYVCMLVLYPTMLSINEMFPGQSSGLLSIGPCHLHTSDFFLAYLCASLSLALWL